MAGFAVAADDAAADDRHAHRLNRLDGVHDARKLGEFRPHARVAKNQRLDADEQLHAAGGGEIGQERRLFADTPVDLGEIAGVGVGQQFEQIARLAAACEGIVVGQFENRAGHDLLDRGEFAFQVRDRFQAIRSEQAAGAAEFAGERAAALSLHGQARPRATGDQIETRHGRLGEIKG